MAVSPTPLPNFRHCAPPPSLPHHHPAREEGAGLSRLACSLHRRPGQSLSFSLSLSLSCCDSMGIDTVVLHSTLESWSESVRAPPGPRGHAGALLWKRPAWTELSFGNACRVVSFQPNCKRETLVLVRFMQQGDIRDLFIGQTTRRGGEKANRDFIGP